MEAKELASKTRMTKSEKAFLIERAAEYGIEFTERVDCQNCYQDLALQIYQYEKMINPGVIPDDERRYILKDGIDLIISGTGERVNEATLTDEIAERLISSGLTKFFSKF